jgi:hypothetical protein
MQLLVLALMGVGFFVHARAISKTISRMDSLLKDHSKQLKYISKDE